MDNNNPVNLVNIDKPELYARVPDNESYRTGDLVEIKPPSGTSLGIYARIHASKLIKSKSMVVGPCKVFRKK